MEPDKLQSSDEYQPGMWHDNHIHGFSIQEGEDGAGKLILDIDHITEWLPPEPKQGFYTFMVAPAQLCFHEITDLVISIDYASLPAAIQPMSIAQIERQEITYPNGYRSYQWRVEVNWPKGEISFKSPGFSLDLLVDPVVSEGQVLSAEQRQSMLLRKAP